MKNGSTLQNNKRKKVMQKTIVVFNSFLVNGKRKYLKHKMTFSSISKNFIYEAIKYIKKTYNSSNIKKFTYWVMG